MSSFKVVTPKEAEIRRIVQDAFKRKRDIALSLLPNSDLKSLGNEFVNKMRSTIQAGQSPIAGGDKRFPAYKNPDKYPKGLPERFNKKPRPVNLTLTGAFLKSLIANVITRSSNKFLQITFDSEEHGIKEVGHRDGANGQPKRPIIPLAGKEDFIAPLRRFLEVTYKEILRAVLAKTKL